MKENIIPELPRYEFNRGAQLTKEEQEGLKKFLDTCFIDLPEKFVRMSTERRKELTELIVNQISWIKEELSLSPEQRAPQFKKIVFFTPERFRKFSRKKGACGMHLFESGEIIVREEENKSQVMADFNHELAHAFSSRVFSVQKDKEGLGIGVGDLLYGYRNMKNDVFNTFNEAIIEMINIETLHYFRSQEAGKDYLAGSNIAYHAVVILFDMLIKEAANRLRRDDTEIRKMLYRGCIEGRVAALKLFEQAFGNGTLKRLAKLRKNTYPFSRYVNLARVFGLDADEYSSRVRRYEAGEEIEILGGIKIKRKVPEQTKDGADKEKV